MPFFYGTLSEIAGTIHIRPTWLNVDFFASALGGDPRMGHQMVFFTPEETFYFRDPIVGAFCPTTEQKIETLLSNYLIQCAQECQESADISLLVTEFRSSQSFRGIIDRAKALLAAEHSFFHGEHGHLRMIEGRILDPSDDPPYVQFVRKSIVRDPESKLTIADAFHRYYQFCKAERQNPLTRAEFKELIAEVIREEFCIGLRHDILDDRGKQQHGWLGISCRLGSAVETGQT